MEYNLSAHDALPPISHATTRLQGEAAKVSRKNDENLILITQHNFLHHAHQTGHPFQHHPLLMLNRTIQIGRAI
jgi:hypothetical protein